jgi:hypothetical protein
MFSALDDGWPLPHFEAGFARNGRARRAERFPLGLLGPSRGRIANRLMTGYFGVGEVHQDGRDFR